VWTFGASMVIFLAGLRQIPVSLYEAASIDGASALTKFRRITLPLLSPVIFFNIILLTIQSFQSFTQAFIVSNGTGGPAESTLLYTLYLYKRAFVQLDMGYASAMAWVLLVVIAAFTALLFWSARFWVFYGDD
jgi:multiple sugar transport system permease protein